MFESLTSRFSGAFSSLRSRGKISSSDIETTCEEIRQALLESDVALSVVEDFISDIRQKSLAALPTLQSGSNKANAIFEIVNSSLIEILGGQARRVRFAKNPPTVIMLAGLQGAGKTTLAGKLAKFYADQGNTPLLVASDLQRPNAVTQLQVVGESVNVPVFAPEAGNGQGDPVKVAKAGIEFAKSKQYNMVIVDTAGRLGVDADLMKQASNIRDAVNPDEILFVVDAMMGQDAVRTSKAFLDGVGFDGVVLTKLDGDARGGAALSIASMTKRPIMFASNGEKLHEFDVFYPERMAERILGMGDVVSLVERAQEQYDEEEARKIQKKIAKNEFGFDDFLTQIQQVKKMGNMKDLVGMIPGASKAMKDVEIEDDAFKHIEAIIHSMTPTERSKPAIIDMKRKTRIAKGSGTKIEQVNQLMKQFDQMSKMMKMMQGPGGKNMMKMMSGMKGGMPGMPGMPGMR